MKSITGTKVTISLMAVGLVGAAFFACGGNTSLSQKSQIAQRAESNPTFDDDLAALTDEIEQDASFLDDPPEDPFDGSFPDPDSFDPGDPNCDCGGPADAGISDNLLGAVIACADANARLRQQLNDVRLNGARAVTVGTADAANAQRGLSNVALIQTGLTSTRGLVNRAFNMGRINAATRDRLLADLNTAGTKLTQATDKYNAGLIQANTTILYGTASQQYAQQGLDYLNQCPPNVAAARDRGRQAATAGLTAALASVNADARNGEGRARAAEALTLIRGALNALRP